MSRVVRAIAAVGSADATTSSMSPRDKRPLHRRFARPLADLIGDTLDPLLAKQGFGESDTILNWDEIAGERLAAVTEPLKMQWPSRGPKRSPDEAAEPATLILRVEGAFAIEVQHLAPLLCERINGRLGWRCVGKIALRQGPIERRPTGRPRAAPPPAEAVAAASKLSEGIADEGLREALTRLGARVLTKPKVK
jgi:hypothetical protein